MTSPRASSRTARTPESRTKPSRLGRVVAALIAAVAVTMAGAAFAPAAANSPTSVRVPTSLKITPGADKVVAIRDTAMRDVSASATMSFAEIPRSGGGAYAAVRVRSGAAGAYIGQVRIWPGGKFTLTVKRASGAGKKQTLTSLGAAVSPQRLKSGQSFTITLSVIGSREATLTASVKLGASKLVGIEVTDASSRRIHTPGASRLEFYTSHGSPSVKVSVTSAAASAPGTAALKPAVTQAPKPVATEVSQPVKTVAPKQKQAGSTAPKSGGSVPKQATEKPGGSASPERAADASTAAQPKTLSAANTGIPAGTVLKVHNGDLVVTTPNEVINGLEVRGTIRIEAPGVLIKNSRIIGGSNPSSTGLVTNIRSGQPFRIIDSELYAATPDPLWNGILGSNFTAERLNIHGVVDPVHIVGSNVTIRSSWLHDNSHWRQDRERGGQPTHDDSIQIVGGSSIVIEGNRLTDAHNAAIQISQSTSRDRLGSIIIGGNYIDGGGCSVNIASTPNPVHPRVENNAFGPERVYATCAVTASSGNAPVLSGNVWQVGGAAMSSYIPR